MKISKKRFWETVATLGNFKIDEADCLRHRKNERCPIVAVAYKLARKEAVEIDLSTVDECSAAQMLGLESEFSNDIAQAADSHTNDLYGKQKKYRKQLLTALKLKEKKIHDEAEYTYTCTY